MKQELIAHNVGFNRPRLTHSQYVDFLFECSARWNGLFNGQDQALRLQAQALAMKDLPANQCPVCIAAGARAARTKKSSAEDPV
jgi:hypothetical protein